EHPGRKWRLRTGERCRPAAGPCPGRRKRWRRGLLGYRQGDLRPGKSMNTHNRRAIGESPPWHVVCASLIGCILVLLAQPLVTARQPAVDRSPLAIARGLGGKYPAKPI